MVWELRDKPDTASDPEDLKGFRGSNTRMGICAFDSGMAKASRRAEQSRGQSPIQMGVGKVSWQWGLRWDQKTGLSQLWGTGWLAWETAFVHIGSESRTEGTRYIWEQNRCRTRVQVSEGRRWGRLRLSTTEPSQRTCILTQADTT